MPSYVVSRRVGLPLQQVFDLVADVERYPEFVPQIIATHVSRRKSREVHVEMLFAFGVLRCSISSIGILHPLSRIDITSCVPLFEFCEFHWRFEPIASVGQFHRGL